MSAVSPQRLPTVADDLHARAGIVADEGQRAVAQRVALDDHTAGLEQADAVAVRPVAAGIGADAVEPVAADQRLLVARLRAPSWMPLLPQSLTWLPSMAKAAQIQREQRGFAHGTEMVRLDAASRAVQDEPDRQPALAKSQSARLSSPTSSAESSPSRWPTRMSSPSRPMPLTAARLIRRATSSGAACAATNCVAPGTPISRAPRAARHWRCGSGRARRSAARCASRPRPGRSAAASTGRRQRRAAGRIGMASRPERAERQRRRRTSPACAHAGPPISAPVPKRAVASSERRETSMVTSRRGQHGPNGVPRWLLPFRDRLADGVGCGRGRVAFVCGRVPNWTWAWDTKTSAILSSPGSPLPSMRRSRGDSCLGERSHRRCARPLEAGANFSVIASGVAGVGARGDRQRSRPFQGMAAIKAEARARLERKAC